MPTIYQLKRRFRTTQSVAKVTRAMEVLAVSKMRRTQERCLAGRPYDIKIRQVIADLAAVPKGEDTPVHPLLSKRPVKRMALVHFTTERGLCGGLNSNMNRSTASFILKQIVPVVLIAVGRKGRDFLVRHGQHLWAEFTGLGDKPSLSDIQPIARLIMDNYTDGFIDEAYLAYPKFVSTLVQSPTIEKLLPVEPASLPAKQNVGYIFEPDADFVLAQILPRFVEMRVYHSILETVASEQSARMVAMRNATDNANELSQELTLTLNKVRQESITKEILDLTTASSGG